MPQLFGTDGVRGLANADLTPQLALSLATAAAQVLTSDAWRGEYPRRSANDRPFAVLGRDPRASGEMLSAAVAAGLASAGVDVIDVGVLPTPAVAFLTSDVSADLGIVISASHNAMPDNGIKVFGAGGRKLSDAAQDAIEALLDPDTAQPRRSLPVGEGVGRITPDPDAAGRYIDHLLLGTPHSLDGLRIVVDCANGASFDVAPEVYRRAGAEVIVVAGAPDGWNINDGVGSTHIDTLRAAVVEHGADLGIAHDGDADRCLAIAGDGSFVDGDVILALLALSFKSRGELVDNTVVSTVMANVGFYQAMKEANITVKTAAVGDRYVLAEMLAGGYSLGGEQSGHIIVSKLATTGDGLLTALNLMSIVASSGRSLAELSAAIPHYPQVLINVPVSDKHGIVTQPAVVEALAAANEAVHGAGRVLLRPSGTEPLVRVMVEAETAEHADEVAQQLAKVVAGVALQASAPPTA